METDHLVQFSFKIPHFSWRANGIKVGLGSWINQIIVPDFFKLHFLETLTIIYPILGLLNPNYKFPMRLNQQTLKKQFKKSR